MLWYRARPCCSVLPRQRPGRLAAHCLALCVRAAARMRALQLTVLAHYVGQLVTHDRTYAVRKGETSNAQLLVPSAVHAICHRPEGGRADDGAVGCVVANVMQHYELLPIGPRLRMLPALLSRRPYEGPDNDAEQDMDESAPARLTRSEVEATLQASPAEIRAEMLRLGAVEIDGRVCLMDNRYESNLMTRFFAEVVLHEWDLGAIRPSVCWNTSEVLASYPRFVLRAFFAKYTADVLPTPEEIQCGGHAPMEDESEGNAAMAGEEGDDAPLALDAAKMSLFCADDLLAGCGRPLSVLLPAYPHEKICARTDFTLKHTFLPCMCVYGHRDF